MKKITIYTILLCVSQYMANGQKLSDFEQKQKDKTINTCPYVFEGIELYYETYLNSADSNMWTSHYVLVTKIFRGKDKIMPGMLEVVNRQCKALYHKDRRYTKYDQTNPKIFFCNDISIATTSSDTIKTDNKIKVEGYNDFPLPKKYINGIVQSGFFGETFKSKKDVYDFLGKIPNVDKSALIGIPDTMKAYRLYYKEDNKARSPYDQKLRDAYDQRVRDSEKVKGDKIKKKVTAINALKSNNAIALDIASNVWLKLWFANMNQIHDLSDDSWYLEFDIMAESGVTAFYYATFMTLSLNLNLDNTFDIKEGDDIDATFDTYDFYGYSMVASAQDDNVITLEIAANDPFYSEIPSDGIKLVHLKLPIDQHNPSTEITPDISTAQYYDDNAADKSNLDYSCYPFSDGSIDLNWPIILDSEGHLPVTAGAGTGSQLIFNGTGFGNNAGTIEFANSNDGGLSTFLLDPCDYTWSDEQIVIDVPSTSTQYTTINGHDVSACAGSGYVIITNSSGYKATQNITVSAAYENIIEPDASKHPIYLTDMGGRGGIKFKCDNTITSYDKVAIKQAMNDWYIATKIKIELVDGDPVDLGYIPNIITRNNTVALMETNYSSDKNPNNNKYYISKYTININNTNPWVYPSNSTHSGGNTDFYQAFLHELGHVYMLDHVNDISQLMYYQMNINPLSLNTDPAPSDANYIIGQSTGINDWEQPAYTLTYGGLPQIPINLRNTFKNSGEIDVAWDDDFGDQSGFNLKIALDQDGRDQQIIPLTGDIRSYQATTQNNKLVPGTPYYFFIEAVNSVGQFSGYSSWLNVDTDPLPAPGTTTGSATGPNDITIVIPVVPGATNYVVGRSTSPNGPFTTIGNVSSGTANFTDSNAKSGVTYYYSITATNGSQSSPNGPIITVTACLTGIVATQNICGPFNSGYDNTRNPLEATNLVSCTTSTTVSSGAILIVEASNSITLIPGFTVSSGSYMRASIVPLCSGTKSTILDTLINNSITEIKAEDSGFVIKIYPNPTTGLLTIVTGVDNASMWIYNILGRLLKQQQLQGTINQTDITNLEPGTYIIKVITVNGQQKSQLIIKK